MYSTSVYYYFQRQIVVLLSGFNPRKYMPQYAKTLTLHKGVDNQIQFQFINQEQKPVDITGKEIICRIINNDGTEVLLRKALTLQLPLTGIAALYVSPAEIEDFPAQLAHYSLEIPVNEFGYPVFVDQNAGARGDLNIVNSVLPSFVPSEIVTIPTGQPFPNPNDTGYGNESANIYYTSIINTADNPILSIQARYTEYNGNVTIEGSTIGSADWYPIQFHEYEPNTTDTFGYTIVGFHPFVRMAFYSNAGVVSNVLAR